jgi:hypothetical protein
MQKGDNHRLQGLHQVHRRLQIVESVDEGTGEVVAGQPNIFFFNNHTHFWRTMPVLCYDPKNIEDIESDKQEDHIYDELRYMCMFRPMKPRVEKPDSRGSFKDERDRYLRAKRMSARRGISMHDAYRRL